MWLPLTCPLLGTWPATQACALTGNQTSDSLVHRPMLRPLSYTSQGLLFIPSFTRRTSVPPPSARLSTALLQKEANKGNSQVVIAITPRDKENSHRPVILNNICNSKNTDMIYKCTNIKLTGCVP